MMKALLFVLVVGLLDIACNNSVDSDRATTDSSIMRADSTSKIRNDSATKVMTDTSKTSVDTVVKK